MKSNGRDDQACSFEVESETGMVVVALHHKSLTFAYLQADIAILIFITVIIRGYPQPRAPAPQSSNTSKQGSDRRMGMITIVQLLLTQRN
jgi:hypothetical protein